MDRALAGVGAKGKGLLRAGLMRLAVWRQNDSLCSITRSFTMIRMPAKLILAAVALAAPLSPALADYVLVGVTDKQAIYADRSSFKKKDGKADVTIVSVFDPAARGIAYIETPNRFDCAFGVVRARASMPYDENGVKGPRLSFSNDKQVVSRTSPLFVVKEMACDGKQPGDLPIVATLDGIRRDARQQIAQVRNKR
jgi:hypothetical protein